MPFIQIKTNVEVAPEAAEALKNGLGKSITHLPGKTEPSLMVCLEDKCQLWFGGKNDKPLAMVEVKTFGGSIDKAGAQAMTEDMYALFQSQLGVAPSDMYVRYIAVTDWGWKGTNL